jgi:hypothetical protein
MIPDVNTVLEDPINLVNPKPFRMWVNNLYFQNCEERLTYHEPGYTLKDYWNKYKWWLRREYRQLQGSYENTRAS